MSITVDLSRGGDVALDDYYRQSYQLAIVRIRSFLAMAEIEQLSIVPPGTTVACFEGFPLAHFTDRLLRLAREGSTI